jgi:hypothetical protein
MSFEEGVKNEIRIRKQLEKQVQKAFKALKGLQSQLKAKDDQICMLKVLY